MDWQTGLSYPSDRTTLENSSITLPQISDANIKTILERQNKPTTPEAIAALRTEMEAANKQAQSALKSGKLFSPKHTRIFL